MGDGSAKGWLYVKSRGGLSILHSSWKPMFCVLKGKNASFHADAKHSKVEFVINLNRVCKVARRKVDLLAVASQISGDQSARSNDPRFKIDLSLEGNNTGYVLGTMAIENIKFWDAVF